MIRAPWSTVTSLVLLATLSGCAHEVTYGYQYRLDQQFGGGEVPEPAPVEARQLLAGARTVAFYPPDNCLNTDTQKDSSVRAACGVLLSRLERDAERAGYEVVSWVNLRGQKRPIDYAREANVDVLFEINQMSPEDVRDVDVQRRLTFFDRTAEGDRELEVSTAVAQRCRDWAKRDTPITAGLTATLDIKTVSVTDGRARWHYRKTLSQSSGRDFPRVSFVGRSEPNKVGNGLVAGGLAGVIVGGVFAGVDAATAGTIDPSTNMPMGKTFGDLPYYFIVGGAVLAVAGAVVIVATGQSRPAPEEVLCLDAHAAQSGPVESAVHTEGPTSSQHTFTETTIGDPLAKEKERLSVAMISEFVTILTELHASHPRGPAAPPTETPARP